LVNTTLDEHFCVEQNGNTTLDWQVCVLHHGCYNAAISEWYSDPNNYMLFRVCIFIKTSEWKYMYFSNCDQRVDFTCSITGGQHLMLNMCWK
jgi:hypothetical protein